MSDHPIVTKIKSCSKKADEITAGLISKTVSAHQADAFAKTQNAVSNKCNAMVKMAIFNAQHHPSKDKPYFTF